jgi:hypothetical protein
MIIEDLLDLSELTVEEYDFPSEDFLEVTVEEGPRSEELWELPEAEDDAREDVPREDREDVRSEDESPLAARLLAGNKNRGLPSDPGGRQLPGRHPPLDIATSSGTLG